jgi:hypothetical protein
MKVCKPLLICLFSLFLSAGTFAQTLFPEKVDVRNTINFCMDCGSPKATCGSYALDYVSDVMNRKYNFKGGAGSISFQVLVDSVGFSCVLSHTDITKSQLSWDLIRYLNGCLWKPAIQGGKRVSSSVNVVFTVANSRISGKMSRMTQEELDELKPPGNPVIYNKQYTYANPSLNKYELTAFTKFNSLLPGNIGLACVVDKTDVLWYATNNGLTRFEDDVFNPINSPFPPTTAINTIATDKNNTKWMCANKAVYTFDHDGWKLFDSTNFKISGAYHIITNPSGEVFFTSNKGLLIVRNDKLVLMDQKLIGQMPSNDVYYAYYDTHERLWIGTSKGSIMIDKKQKVTSFNTPGTPLYNVSISNVAEDEKGNLYFSLLDTKKPTGNSDDEGIAVMNADGIWVHYNDKNSGMPSNHVNSLWYDKFEHVLWIGTHQSGLVRFDLKNGWENYNNNNSAIPGFDISQITQDSKGVIYVATANGMLMVKKK